MSYEGSEQVICDRGHYYEIAHYMGYECPECKSDQTAWVNQVDDTNCREVGVIPLEIIRKLCQVREEKHVRCEHCGSITDTTPAVFLPTRVSPETWEAHQHWRNPETEELELLPPPDSENGVEEGDG